MVQTPGRNKPQTIIMLNNAICFEDKIADIEVEHDTYRINYIQCSPPTRLAARGTIVLLHDFFRTRWQFQHVIDLFALAGYDVIVPELPGQLVWSRQWTNESCNAQRLAKQLAHLLEHLSNGQKFHVVGCGLGAELALILSKQYSNKIASITSASAAAASLRQIPVSIDQLSIQNGLLHTFVDTVPDAPRQTVPAHIAEDIKNYAVEVDEPERVLVMISVYLSVISSQAKDGSILNRISTTIPCLALQPQDTVPNPPRCNHPSAKHHNVKFINNDLA